MKYSLFKCQKTSQNLLKTVKSVLVLNTLHGVLRLILDVHGESIKKAEPLIGLLDMKVG